LFDDENRSWAYRLTAPLLHPTFAAVPIVREAAHAVYTGHDPAFGVLTAGTKTLTDMVRGLKKGPDFYNFGDQLKYINALVGTAFGLSSMQMGRWQKFAYNYFVTRSEQPRTAGDWYRAFRYGTAREPRRH
jgi:hypothetical protein